MIQISEALEVLSIRTKDKNKIPIAILIVISLVGSSLGSLQSSTRNHDLLTKIGLKRVRTPQSHHSKRLAVQSRHRSRSDDSHMFIIKLPPNPHYYGFTNPNSIHEPIKKKSIPIGFKSNGKPAKIYHWNLPVLKSIAAHKLKSRKNDIHDITINDFPNPESWNEVLDKPEKDNYKPRKPSYYVPAKPKKSQFTKYFPGNGKPHSFYVIEKSKRRIIIDFCHRIVIISEIVAWAPSISEKCKSCRKRYIRFCIKNPN